MIPRILIAFALCMMHGLCAHAQDAGAGKRQLEFFFTPSCHVCHEVGTTVIAKLRQEYQDRIVFIDRDISDIENYRLFLGYKQQFGLRADTTVPAVFFDGRFLAGKEAILSQLPALVCAPVAAATAPPAAACPVDLKKHFASFAPLAVAGAGLVDGINPCAFTVIVFFVSFLALQGYRKKELAAIGLFFIAAVFITYLLLGIGALTFFYSLGGVWVLRTVVNAAIGWASLLLGGLAVYDALLFKRTGNPENSKLQLPPAVKRRIRAVIGMGYRKEAADGPGGRPSMIRLSLAALSTGFVVSLLEAVCTGQAYLPTISFILKTTSLRLQAFTYLVWYNLMFVMPLIAVLACALFGATSSHFTGFMRRHFMLVKLSMAILFFGMGIFLLWRFS